MTGPPSHFTLHVDDATREIMVSGEFDISAARDLTSAIAVLQHAARADITVRLDHVNFIDAAGLGTMAGANTTQMRNGTRLRVTGATAKVRRVFALGDLTGLLHSRADCME
jgi:anti-sigma B factor antagonist